MTELAIKPMQDESFGTVDTNEVLIVDTVRDETRRFRFSKRSALMKALEDIIGKSKTSELETFLENLVKLTEKDTFAQNLVQNFLDVYCTTIDRMQSGKISNYTVIPEFSKRYNASRVFSALFFIPSAGHRGPRKPKETLHDRALNTVRGLLPQPVPEAV